MEEDISGSNLPDPRTLDLNSLLSLNSTLATKTALDRILETSFGKHPGYYFTQRIGTD